MSEDNRALKAQLRADHAWKPLADILEEEGHLLEAAQMREKAGISQLTYTVRDKKTKIEVSVPYATQGGARAFANRSVRWNRERLGQLEIVICEHLPREICVIPGTTAEMEAIERQAKQQRRKETQAAILSGVRGRRRKAEPEAQA